MSKVQLILAISIWLPLDWCPARGQNTNTCATLSPPVNGFAVFPCSPTAGVTCVFACNQGYSISGIRSTTCRAATGRWTNRVPTCVFNNQGSGSGNGNQGTFNNQITCSALDAPAGGSNSGACMEGSVPGSICTAACPAGFTRGGGGPSYTCQPDGTWTPTAVATCTRITNCPNLVLPANMLGAGNCAPGVVGSTCTFSCAAGAVLDGLALVTCQANGTWSGAVPQCRVLMDQNPQTAVLSTVAPLGTCNERTVKLPQYAILRKCGVRATGARYCTLTCNNLLAFSPFGSRLVHCNQDTWAPMDNFYCVPYTQISDGR